MKRMMQIKTHFTVQSSVTTECVPLFTAKMQIIMIMIKKIMIIMKIMNYNEK